LQEVVILFLREENVHDKETCKWVVLSWFSFCLQVPKPVYCGTSAHFFVWNSCMKNPKRFSLKRCLMRWSISHSTSNDGNASWGLISARSCRSFVLLHSLLLVGGLLLTCDLSMIRSHWVRTIRVSTNSLSFIFFLN